MNLAKWQIDYIQKKSIAGGNGVARPKTITDLVVEEKERKSRESTNYGTPEKVRRILAADEAQLNELT